MIFNLNEQKVLSDPSGSSVFKGEKDFNDIVVNLPDNIDGHTATQLNYVMHFVDSDGGYSTKILNVDSSGETLKATATVSTNITSKAQAFYAYVLMTDDEETVIGKTNGVIVMIHPVPDEENEIIPPADADKIIKGLEEIVQEATETIETATEAISSKQDKLTAGENITISGENVISASSGSDDYTDLENKPSINNVILLGNKSSDDLSLQGKLTAGENITIENNVISAEGGTDDYRELDNIPVINTFPLIKGINLDTSQFAINMDSNEFVRASLQQVPKYILEDYFRFYNGGDLFDSPYYRSVYNFNNLIIEVEGEEVNYQRTGFWFMQGVNCQNVPQAFSGLISNNTIMLVSHFTGNPIYNTSDVYIYRAVYIIDSQNKIRTFSQLCLAYANATGQVVDITNWQEIGGGSQIVSGVVNANGTITFTDSDGNTFTTSGSSVIGPQGDDYVLTAQDKSDIADIVLSELPTTQGVQYGNTNN